MSAAAFGRAALSTGSMRADLETTSRGPTRSVTAILEPRSARLHDRDTSDPSWVAGPQCPETIRPPRRSAQLLGEPDDFALAHHGIALQEPACASRIVNAGLRAATSPGRRGGKLSLAKAQSTRPIVGKESLHVQA